MQAVQNVEESDYVITPYGHLGCNIAVAEVGRAGLLEVFSDVEEALTFVATRMLTEDYFPTVWWVSDHGSHWPIDLDGNEVPTC